MESKKIKIKESPKVILELCDKTVVSIAEYRKILGDTKSTDAQITKRLQFIEALCKNVIKPELEKIYGKH